MNFTVITPVLNGGPHVAVEANLDLSQSTPSAVTVEALKEKTLRAGVAKLFGHLGRSLLRLGSIIVLARLLEPSDFGIVAMVTVLTGMFEVFSTGGLSAATVQRPEVSDDQISALFWFNMALGLLLAALCLVAAPLLADFYNEPRTAQVLAAMAPFFILTAASVQHSAVLLRQMQHATLSAIEVAAEAVAAVIGIAMALAGWGYWALVASSLALPFVVTIGVWIATGWIPQARCRASGIVPMLHFGGTLTLNNLVVYGGYNAEKLLLGRYFGPDTLGLYSRIYELINLPTRIVNSAFGSVTFAALSRVQTVPARFKRYFLAGYSLVLAITIPTTIFCAVLADDIIIVVLGPKWIEGALIFRLLAPTILVFGIINPTAMLLQSSGLHRRSLNIAFVIAPLAIVSYLIGIPYGPTGVALAYSTAMTLWVVPHLLWCLHGTPVTVSDLLPTIARPLIAGIAAAAAGILVQHLSVPIQFSLLRIALAGTAMLAVYVCVLLFVMKQKEFYLDLVRGLMRNRVLAGMEDSPAGGAVTVRTTQVVT